MRPSSFILAVIASLASIAYRPELVFAEVGYACDWPTARVCGAGDLPRVTNREWGEAEVQRFAERAAKGTVAVAVEGKAVKVLPNCRLPGGYTEVKTQSGQGRLWATNRPLLLAGELEGAGCAEATHAVAAFARARGGSRTFSGVLIPLPCPSIADNAPAPGCIGRGLTGPIREARADSLTKKLEATAVENVSVRELLEVYALAPADALPLGVLFAGRVNSECALKSQMRWIAYQYRTSQTADGKRVATLLPADSAERTIDRPVLDAMRGRWSCIFHPVFRKCFSGIAEPVDVERLCWEAAPATSAAPVQTRGPTPGPPTNSPKAGTKP